MSYTVIGTTTYTSTSTGLTTLTISVPTGTQIGDMLFLSTTTLSDYATTDSRLQRIPSGAFTGVGLFGGIADSLADIDVDVTSANAPWMLYLVAIRGPRNTQRYAEWDTLSSPGVMAADNGGPWPMDLGLCFTADGDGSIFPTLPDDPDGDWTGLTALTLTFTNGFGTFNMIIRPYYLPGPLSAPEDLWVGGTQGVDYSRRQSANVFFTSIGDDNYLRQRQSPVRTPSRVRGIDLRNRQTPRTT